MCFLINAEDTRNFFNNGFNEYGECTVYKKLRIYINKNNEYVLLSPQSYACYLPGVNIADKIVNADQKEYFKTLETTKAQAASGLYVLYDIAPTIKDKLVVGTIYKDSGGLYYKILQYYSQDKNMQSLIKKLQAAYESRDDLFFSDVKLNITLFVPFTARKRHLQEVGQDYVSVTEKGTGRVFCSTNVATFSKLLLEKETVKAINAVANKACKGKATLFKGP